MRNTRDVHYKRVIEIDSGNFKARVGLADIALREGKLAHVIHHYQEAARVTRSSRSRDTLAVKAITTCS